MKRILMATDFSETADHALRQAVQLSLAHDAELHVFHAVLLHEPEPDKLEAQLQDYLDSVEDKAWKTLENRSNQLEGIRAETSVQRSISAFDAIIEKIGELAPDLVVMGTHGRRGLGKLLLGSVAERVVRHSDRNVMTVRRDATIADHGGKFGRLLVAVDFSESSRRALEIANLFVTAPSAITAFHAVAEPGYARFLPSIEITPQVRKRIRDELRDWVGDRAGQIVVGQGETVEELRCVAEETATEAIVLGSRGLTGLEHLLIGSVAERVVQTAKVPVLVVK